MHPSQPNDDNRRNAIVTAVVTAGTTTVQKVSETSTRHWRETLTKNNSMDR